MNIQSVQNPKVKDWAKLNQKKYREESRLFIVEGEHLVQEALKAKMVKEIVTTNEDYRNSRVNVYYVNEDIIKKITNTVTPQSILAICYIMELDVVNQNKVLLLDQIQDPGNLGTIIRSADAFGMDLVVLGDGCVDLYNDKVVRSTQGSLFHLPIIKQNLVDYISEFDGKVYGTSLHNGISLKQVTIEQPFALVVGNEGNGVSKEVLNVCHQNIYIDMPGKSESLNVSIATSIILYEFTK